MKEQIQSPSEISFSFLYLIIFIMNKITPYVMHINITFRGIYNELKKSLRPNKQTFSHLSIHWWLAFTLSLKEMWCYGLYSLGPGNRSRQREGKEKKDVGDPSL